MTSNVLNLLRACLFVGIGALSYSRAPMAQEAASSDRDEIVAMLQAWEEAWNRHDMRAFASLFHEDGVWVLWTGEIWAGRKAIEDGHAEVHPTVSVSNRRSCGSGTSLTRDKGLAEVSALPRESHTV